MSDSDPQPESAVKQPDRIATSKIEKYLDESREQVEATRAFAEESASNSDLATYYARKSYDRSYYVMCVFAVVAGGLLAAELLAFIVIVLMAVLHVIVL